MFSLPSGLPLLLWTRLPEALTHSTLVAWYYKDGVIFLCLPLSLPLPGSLLLASDELSNSRSGED
jgi:hypothetical protein